MSLCGYISSTGSAVVQSQSAINSIINIYMFGPLLIFVGVLIVGDRKSTRLNSSHVSVRENVS